MNPPHGAALARAKRSLEGLALGDSFGQGALSTATSLVSGVRQRRVSPGPWRYSDDTVMGLSVVEVLEEFQHIDRDALATRFGEKFLADPSRGYGALAYRLLSQMGRGARWQDVVHQPYDGAGSMGNGGAMRAGPVGAYFANDPENIVSEARASAEVTHAHAEGKAGAIAVALAAGAFSRARRAGKPFDAHETLRHVLSLTPDGETKTGIAQAIELLRKQVTPEEAAERLGAGQKVIAPDSVPFALWSSVQTPSNYEETIWRTMQGLTDPAADRDTICAIVGSIVVLFAEDSSIPRSWISSMELSSS